MQSSVSLLYLQILDWLHEQLGENTDYQLEVCDRTISILQSIISQNQKQDKEASIRIKDLKLKTKEYRMESRAMKVTLNFIGLTLDQLSCCKYLCSLSKTAELLKLSHLSDTNYIIGEIIYLYKMLFFLLRFAYSCDLEFFDSFINRGNRRLMDKT